MGRSKRDSVSSLTSDASKPNVVNWSDAVDRVPDRGYKVLAQNDLERGRPRKRRLDDDASECSSMYGGLNPSISESVGKSLAAEGSGGGSKSGERTGTRGRKRDKRRTRTAVCCRYVVLFLLQIAVVVSASFALVSVLRLASTRANAFSIASETVSAAHSQIPGGLIGTLISSASSAGMLLILAVPYALMFVYCLPKLFQENQSSGIRCFEIILSVVLAVLQSVGHCILLFHVLPLINSSMLTLLVLPSFALPGAALKLVRARSTPTLIVDLLTVILLSGSLGAVLFLLHEPTLYWLLPVCILLSGSADAHAAVSAYRLWASKPPRRYLIAAISHFLCLIAVCAGVGISQMFGAQPASWRSFSRVFTRGFPFLFKMPALFEPMLCHVITGFCAFLFTWLACAVQGQRMAAVIPLALSLPLSQVVLFLAQNGVLPVWLSGISGITEFERSIPTEEFYYYVGVGVCLWLAFLLSVRNTWYQDYRWVPLEHNLWFHPRYNSVFGPVSLLENIVARKLTRRDVQVVQADVDADDEDYETTTHINPLSEHTEGSHLGDSGVREASASRGAMNMSGHGAMVFICSTLWHETRVEMSTLLNSMLTVDMEKNEKFVRLESHIFFDNAYVDTNEDGQSDTLAGDLGFNTYAQKLLELVPQFVDERRAMTVTETPYGHRLRCFFPDGMQLCIHFKDARLIANKKRWSQVQYLFYILHFRCSPAKNGTDSYTNKFILTTDGDVGFDYTSVEDLLLYLMRDETVGAVCARIHPVGKSPVAWFQIFEYSIGHWLMKTFESVTGSVLCCPGCFSLFRAEAMADVVHLYSAQPTSAVEYLMYDQGEDRWLSTLLLKTGWILQYCASAEATTQCPESFAELFNQRRRWLTSTIANLNDLLVLNAAALVNANSGLSWVYLIYQVVLLFCSLLSPAICLLVIAGGLNVTFGWSSLGMTILASCTALCFCLVCMKCTKDTQIVVASLLSVVFALAMTAVLVGLCVTVVENISNPNSIFICFIASLIVSTALLHPSECWVLVHSLVFFLAIPTSYVLLVIYAVANLHVTSWGTREGAVEGTDTDDEPNEYVLSASSTYKEVNIGSLTITYGPWYLAFGYKAKTNYQSLVNVNDSSADFDNEIVLLDTLRRRDALSKGKGPLNSPALESVAEEVEHTEDFQDAVTSGDSVRRYDEESSVSEGSFVNDASGPSTTPSTVKPRQRHGYDSPDKVSRVSSLFSTCSAISKRINDEERDFWAVVVPRYLSPNNETMNPQELQTELTQMRNYAMLGMILFNLIWLVAVTALSYQEHLQVVDTNVLGLVFLTVFSGLLVVQYIAMAYHRIGTAIHLLATAKKQGGRLDKVKKVKKRPTKVSTDQTMDGVAHEDRHEVQVTALPTGEV